MRRSIIVLVLVATGFTLAGLASAGEVTPLNSPVVEPRGLEHAGSPWAEPTYQPAVEIEPVLPAEIPPSYDVLAGEMRISLDTGPGFSIDKSKVAVTLGDNQKIKIPVTIKNLTKEFTLVRISSRVPDFITDGYVVADNSTINMMPSLVDLMLAPESTYEQGIFLGRGEDTLDKVEIWVYAREIIDNGIARELVLRLLVTKAEQESL